MKRDRCRGVSGLLVLVTCLPLAACSTSAYRPVTEAFGKATRVTIEAQRKDIAELHDIEVRARRLGWLQAGKTVSLVGCNGLIRDPSDYKDCRLVDGSGARLDDAEKYAGLSELGDQLIAYSDALVALAGDHTADAAAFSTSLADLAKSIATLEALLAQRTGAKAISPAKFAAVATIFDRLGNLYEEQARTNALRRLIIAGEPTISATIEALKEADVQVKISRLARLRKVVEADSFALNDAIAAGKSAESLTVLQAKVFDGYARLRADAEAKSPFELLADAHGNLVKAARANASGKELMAAIINIADAAKVIRTAVETIQKP